MELKKPKPKKFSVPQGKSMLPLKHEVVGVFNGHSVTVTDLDSMMYLYEAGNFGKGSLSKGEPNYHIRKDDIPKIILEHQFENQRKWNASGNSVSQQTSKGFAKNNLTLSLQSVSRFLESSFEGSEQESWKSWKENEEQGCQNLIRKNDSLKSDFLCEDETDESDYTDENFISMVDNILESRQIRKPISFKGKSEEVIVLNASFNPSASDLSVVNANARFEKLTFMPIETLKLNLEESFFLKSVFGCLNIVDLNFSEMGVSELWETFSSVNKNFLERYITYHYYRSKGWVVRSGLKFGGDYLLYKDGPAYYHASYMVKVLDRRKKLTWREFLTMNRLVETYNKDLVLSNVLPTVLPTSASDTKSFPGALKNHSVQEILVKRWFPTKERFSKTDETLT